MNDEAHGLDLQLKQLHDASDDSDTPRYWACLAPNLVLACLNPDVQRAPEPMPMAEESQEKRP